MARDALVQVRLDPETKKSADELFSSMGMSTSEAVRLFLAQCVAEGRLPFVPCTARKHGAGAAFGMLNIFASPSKREKERDAWIESLSLKAARDQ